MTSSKMIKYLEKHCAGYLSCKRCPLYGVPETEFKDSVACDFESLDDKSLKNVYQLVKEGSDEGFQMEFDL